MKIKYESVTGEITEVEVSEEIGAVIIDSRRKEENLARKERYHCYSLDAIKYGDNDKFAPTTGETPLTELIRNEDNSYIYEAFSKLSDIQQRRLLMFASGMTLREIAAEEKVHFTVVQESLNAGRKKFLKFFRKTPLQNGTFFSVDTEGANETASSERRKKR